ncbi:MAG: CDP-alcohol phosphatidyltransferase family protein [Lachnospiraceae bacterium]|nr:CDP-alcohol phosphatidyltransferase family protein [Lachnospiraceae bacterium]
MIGFYDYTVILTYMSLVSGVIGMFCTFTGHMHWAIFCLALCGLFDTFDGKVARTKKNRTEDEKRFGIQIDSLCDMVCFGAFPVAICFHSGMYTIWGMAILVFYCLAGLIRLAYFNVLEERRQQETEENRKYYQGLPITSIAVILPLIHLSSAFFQQNYILILNIGMLVTGILFILNFQFRKPTNKELAVLIVIVAAAVIYMVVYYKWRGIFRWNWRSLADNVSTQ